MWLPQEAETPPPLYQALLLGHCCSVWCSGSADRFHNHMLNCALWPRAYAHYARLTLNECRLDGTDLSFNGDELHVQLPENAGWGWATARHGRHVALDQVHAFGWLSLGPVVVPWTLCFLFNMSWLVCERCWLKKTESKPIKPITQLWFCNWKKKIKSLTEVKKKKILEIGNCP